MLYGTASVCRAGGVEVGQVSGTLDHPTPGLVVDTYFRGNTAGDPGGGAFYMLDDVSLDSCVFYQNRAPGEAGGGTLWALEVEGCAWLRTQSQLTGLVLTFACRHPRPLRHRAAGLCV